MQEDSGEIASSSCSNAAMLLLVRQNKPSENVSGSLISLWEALMVIVHYYLMCYRLNDDLISWKIIKR